MTIPREAVAHKSHELTCDHLWYTRKPRRSHRKIYGRRRPATMALAIRSKTLQAVAART
jgi:hypothetical protein